MFGQPVVAGVQSPPERGVSFSIVLFFYGNNMAPGQLVTAFQSEKGLYPDLETA